MPYLLIRSCICIQIDDTYVFSAGSKKGNKRNQYELYIENTVKDTERIELEKEKLTKEVEVLEAKRAKLVIETEKLKSERDMVEMQKIYYQLKIQQEFGMTISDP